MAAAAVGVACASGPGVCGCAGGERGDGYWIGVLCWLVGVCA